VKANDKCKNGKAIIRETSTVTTSTELHNQEDTKIEGNTIMKFYLKKI